MTDPREWSEQDEVNEAIWADRADRVHLMSGEIAQLATRLVELLGEVRDYGGETFGEINQARRYAENGEMTYRAEKRGKTFEPLPLDLPYWHYLEDVIGLLMPLQEPKWDEKEFWPRDE